MEGITRAADILELSTFEQLYGEYAQRLFRFIFLRTGHREDSEDILATVFVRLWEFSEKYPNTPIRSISALLYRIARNVVIDEQRKRRLKALSIEELALQGIEFASRSSPDQYSQAEAACALTAMQALSHKEYALLELRFVEGFRVVDIAAIYGISESSAAVRIHRATKHLRRLMRAG